MNKKQQLSATVSALERTLSANHKCHHKLYNAITLHGRTYELVTDYSTDRPCTRCDIQPICEATGMEPGLCTPFATEWNQYFKRLQNEAEII